MAEDEGMSDWDDSHVSREYRARPDPIGYFVAMAIAGAVYPVLAYGGLIALVDGLRIEIDFQFMAGLLVAASIGVPVGVLVGLGSVVCARALQWTLAAHVDRTRFYTFAGGLAGLFLLGLGLMISPHPPVNHHQQANVGLLLLVGPGIATPLFQFAAAWGEWPREGVLPPRGPWQFGVRQILAAMVWVALGLTLLKLSGRLTPWSVMWITVWGIYQGVTMWVVLRLGDLRSRRLFQRGLGDDGEMRG